MLEPDRCPGTGFSMREIHKGFQTLASTVLQKALFSAWKLQLSIYQLLTLKHLGFLDFISCSALFLLGNWKLYVHFTCH